jgi:putative redox protein
MEVTVQHLGNVTFQAIARGHRVVCDQPPENGGADGGMTPPEFLLASLGTCAGYYAAAYLKLHGLPQDGLEIHVRADKVKGPARLDAFRIEVTVPGLEQKHESGIMRAVRGCLIHHTLEIKPAIETVLRTAVPA